MERESIGKTEKKNRKEKKREGKQEPINQKGWLLLMLLQNPLFGKKLNVQKRKNCFSWMRKHLCLLLFDPGKVNYLKFRVSLFAVTYAFASMMMRYLWRVQSSSSCVRILFRTIWLKMIVIMSWWICLNQLGWFLSNPCGYLGGKCFMEIPIISALFFFLLLLLLLLFLGVGVREGFV